MDTEDLERMLVEIVTGKPPSLNTPEANAIREKLRIEVQAIHDRGGEVEIQSEIQIDDQR
jgi:hypothetical protein